MKKTILTVVLALVLVLSFMAVVACEPTTECEHSYVDGVCTKCNAMDPNYKPEQPAGDVPTEEGKVTYYFTLADSSPEQIDMVSYWIVGVMTGWAETPAAGALEAKNVAGTKIYYIITDAPKAEDANADGKYGFKVTLGYNAKSGLPDNVSGMQGVSWANQSLECPSGVDNQLFEYKEGDETVNLGTQTFEEKMPAPERIDTTLVVKFAEALPETTKVAIVGNFNAWTADNSWATRSQDGKSYSLALTDALCMKHDYKIKVFANYEEGNFWNMEDNKTPYGIEVSGKGGSNLSVTLGTLDDGEEVVLNDSFPAPYNKEITLPTDENEHFVTLAAADVTLKVTFTDALPENYVVVIMGKNFGNWNYSAENCLFTASEDRKSFTLVTSYVAGENEYKLIVLPAAVGEDGNVWLDTRIEFGPDGAVGKDGTFLENAKFTLTASDMNQVVDLLTDLVLPTAEVPAE